MLGGVLLHMIDAARPVNLAVDGTCGNFSGGVMDHVLGITWSGDVWPSDGVRNVNDFYDLRIAQRAHVVRLAAGGGIEGGLIKGNFPAGAFRRAGDDRGVEFAQERIVVIEPVRQVSILSIRRKHSIETEAEKAGTR